MKRFVFLKDNFDKDALGGREFSRKYRMENVRNALKIFTVR